MTAQEEPDAFDVESEIHGSGVVTRVKFHAVNLEQIAAVLARLEGLAAQPLLGGLDEEWKVRIPSEEKSA
jgi:hypothetical protein